MSNDYIKIYYKDNWKKDQIILFIYKNKTNLFDDFMEHIRCFKM